MQLYQTISNVIVFLPKLNKHDSTLTDNQYLIQKHYNFIQILFFHCITTSI